MVRPIAGTPTPGPRYDVSVIGDSLTHNETLSVPPHLLWPALLQTALRDAGARVRCRNFAKSGNTTTNMVARVAELTRYGVPKLGIIFGGVNDPGAPINQATTQANIESMGQTLLDAGTDYLVVVSPQFLNFTSGGDATNQTKPGGAYADVYDAQMAAVAALNADNAGTPAAFCDLWDWMRDLIVAGTDTLASASWHVAGTNQHLNAYGNRIVANAVCATIAAQIGWLDALRAG